VQARGIDLVLNAVRTQTFNPDAFTQFGIDLAAKKIVVVKSTQHFYAGFEPVAAEILYVAAPGAITPDFANIPFEKLTAPYWPRVEDPFAE
jgi:microcystin degradation protein MlrC